MVESVPEQTKQALKTAEGLYHRLVLLVGPSGSGKTDMLRTLAQERGTQVINVNLYLSSALLELTGKQRSLRLPSLLEEMLENASSPILLDNLEILFDQDLHQDPLRCLQNLSRNRVVLASWNGIVRKKHLLYAEPSHPEFHSYEAADLLYVAMPGHPEPAFEEVTI